MSACGNHGIIGTADGHIEKYNIQSGLFRGEFIHTDVKHNRGEYM